MSDVIVKVSGKTYWAALDPAATGVPGECGWPAARVRRVGRGQQWQYVLSREAAEQMREHLFTVGVSFVDGADPEDAETCVEGRACLRDAQRIAALLADGAVPSR